MNVRFGSRLLRETLVPVAGEEGAGAAQGLEDLGLGRVPLELAPFGEIARLREEAEELGLKIAVPALDAALGAQ